MADFADFALKIAPVVGSRDEVSAILNRLSGQQVTFASQDEPLYALIDQWLDDESQTVNINRELALPALGLELEGKAGSMPVLWDRGNAKSFGQYFRARKGTLTRLYGLTERDGHAGVTKIMFNRRPNGDLGDLGEQRATPLSHQDASEGVPTF